MTELSMNKLVNVINHLFTCCVDCFTSALYSPLDVMCMCFASLELSSITISQKLSISIWTWWLLMTNANCLGPARAPSLTCTFFAIWSVTSCSCWVDHSSLTEMNTTEQSRRTCWNLSDFWFDLKLHFFILNLNNHVYTVNVQLCFPLNKLLYCNFAFSMQ